MKFYSLSFFLVKKRPFSDTLSNCSHLWLCSLCKKYYVVPLLSSTIGLIKLSVKQNIGLGVWHDHLVLDGIGHWREDQIHVSHNFFPSLGPQMLFGVYWYTRIMMGVRLSNGLCNLRGCRGSHAQWAAQCPTIRLGVLHRCLVYYIFGLWHIQYHPPLVYYIFWVVTHSILCTWGN